MPGSFNYLISSSLFEHTPYWREIIKHNQQWLSGRHGRAFFSFGAEGNVYHPPDPWAIVPVHEFLEYVQQIGFVAVECFFEDDRYGAECPGAVVVELETAT